MLSKYILAVDLGTSGPKVALVSTDGEVVDHTCENTETILLPGGGAEENPDDWWNAITRSAKKLLSNKTAHPDDIVAISCTSQWSGTVAIDNNGNALMNSITWMDSRGAKYIKEITGGLINIEGYSIIKLKKWLSLTGGIPGHSGKDSIAHILYIKNVYPDIYDKTYKFLEPKDFLNLKLTGRYYASYDSIALHWLTDNRNISKIRYDDSLIKMVGIDREKLPKLKRAVDVIGPVKEEVAEELGLSKGTLVIVGTPDLHSAAIGSGAVEDYEGHLYIGTSSWLICHVPFKKTDIFHKMASLPSAIPEKYIIANEQEIAGEAINFLRNNIFFPDDELTPEIIPENVHEAFNRIAEKTSPGSDKLIFTPWLYGERTPVDDHTIRGGFHNMTLRTTRAHMIRAVFEGVAYNTRWMLKYVEKFIKKPMDNINFIGGGAVSNLWCQIFADVLGRNIRQVKDPIEANLRGAGFLGSVAMGYLKFEEISKKIKFKEIYKPNPKNKDLYDELFKEYVCLYKKNKTIFSRLNKGNL
ncbi:MAG: xylulose kinase [Desulfobacterales bacterium]|nr:xylulose kinase [Desulfobacterales bacterium]MCP4159047.1 xylulose kinase [Deltaproteobacteria bacterium]